MNEFDVEVVGMRCTGCARAVERSVSHVEGVHAVASKLSTKTIHVWGDPSPDDVRAAITCVGYSVGTPDITIGGRRNDSTVVTGSERQPSARSDAKKSYKRRIRRLRHPGPARATPECST